jgi:benzoyl-CoA reductase/2-hydroxyglutaryl-CoA dehydratase subunit BcrC/BadD/HgdB
MNDLTLHIKEFQDIAGNPRAQFEKFLKEGKKVVGCMPYFCPEELVYAAGMIPFGLWGARMQVSEAKRYFPAFICSILQTILELGIKGSYNGMSAVMIPIMCDSLKGMSANWESSVKNIPVINVAHAQNRKIAAGAAFTASQYRKIRNELARLSDTDISDKDISLAVSNCNKHRQAMRRLSSMMGEHPDIFTPAVRNAIFKSAWFTDVLTHTRMAEKLISLLSELPPAAWTGVKVVTTGIIADDPEFLSILEDNKIAVIDDQIAHESLAYITDVPVTADPIEGLAQRIGLIEGCTFLYDPGKQRGKMLLDLVKKSGADGVIFVMTKFCDPDEYDYVPLKEMLDAEGIPNVLIETDQQAASTGQVRTALETFGEILRLKG